MLQATLNGKIEIEICNKWQDLTIRQGVELFKIANRFPENVKKLYGAYLQPVNDKTDARKKELEETITDEQQIKILPKLYGELMQLLTNIDAAIIERLVPNQRSNFYQKHLVKFVVGILHFPIDLKVQNIESFELDGTVYVLPKSRKFSIGTVEINEPMSHTSILEFTEAADLQLAAKSLAGGKIELLPNIVAILCRPEGEKYNEAVSLQRAAVFMDKVTMDVAWEVFFCLIELFSTLKQRSRISLQVAELRKEMTANSSSLGGMFKLLMSQKQQQPSRK